MKQLSQVVEDSTVKIIKCFIPKLYETYAPWKISNHTSDITQPYKMQVWNMLPQSRSQCNVLLRSSLIRSKTDPFI